MNNWLSKCLFSTKFLAFFLFSIVIATIVLFFSITNIAYAQLNGCSEINVGNPGSGITIPPQCSSGGSFTNPFPGGWTPNRLDMGYDGTFTNQIVAPFDGIITFAGLYHGWVGNNGVTSYGVQIEANTDVGLPTVPGIPNTKSLYFTEGVYPLVTSGQKVTAGTPIAKAWPSPYGDAYATSPTGDGEIEWGVSQDVSGSNWHQTDTYSIAVGNCTSASRQMVLNFSQWAQQKLQVSAPSQTAQAGCP